MEKILVDSNVFLEGILDGERKAGAEKVLHEIHEGRLLGATSTLSIAEVKYHVLRKLGHAKASEAAYLVEAFPNVEVVDVTPSIAAMAADIRHKYYDKKNRPVSIADAIQVATAIQGDCSKIISGDSDFEGLDEIKAERF